MLRGGNGARYAETQILHVYGFKSAWVVGICGSVKVIARPGRANPIHQMPIPNSDIRLLI
jgi:hypothetical protein